MKGRPHQHNRHERRAGLSQQDIPAPIEIREPDHIKQAIVSVVYVTADPTFDGPIAGYLTLGPDDDDEDEDGATSSPPAHTTTPSRPKSTTAKTTSSNSYRPTSHSTELPSSIIATASVGGSGPILAATSYRSTNTATLTAPTATASNKASSTAAADTSSEGMSVGGKAGLTIGILLLFGVALVLLLFFFKKKRQAAKSERLDDDDDEKSLAAATSARRAEADRVGSQHQASQGSTQGGAEAAAPILHRLSPLRPVTQFQPFNEKQEMNQAPGRMSGVITPISTAAKYQPNEEHNKNNPFGNHAEAIDTPNTTGPAVIEGFTATGEVIATSAVAASAISSNSAPTVQPAGPARVPVKPLGLARSASKAGNGRKQMDFTTNNITLTPPSPSGSEFSNASTVQSAAGKAIAAAGGPPNTTVHRVQLDFAPSMDDELELKAGQLIRILHEYDDGWALCIRLDRSKQGVVPRTCLSTRPVKPRPQQTGPQGSPGMRPQQRPMSPAMNKGPPRGPGMQGPPRPMPPNGQGPPRGSGMMQGPPKSMAPGNRPMTPQGNRPMVPPNHPNQQRPMTPQGPLVPRPLTPQGQTNQQRPVTPPNQQVAPPNKQVAPPNQQVTPPNQKIDLPVEGRARRDSDTDPISSQPTPLINHSETTHGPSNSPSPQGVRSQIERKPLPGQAL
ncbi:hypothetical protein DSL72_005436 [Monilinia vaccinii-corymbosi]|uniref:SH3 domain-containing protein n=1 Tax=Monilinia vaccinii-corymbosi TaxID=61207 RepID=A0A8A3PFN6_9HELO|nr:hypothetical protein DSL72_005436 [Monilinia vaccinii-corymbosi]